MAMNIGVTSSAGKTGMQCTCAACAGLECLCRPRFFAGQLLTEEDLNRLDHYIVAKQKLHNRYLHGWGVVCGLDVTCDGCDSGYVGVGPGYALSPCGEDIIVCGDTRVSICDLIAACKPAPDPDCTAPSANLGCDAGVQQWVLAICYAETPSRGVAPLRSACGCGGQCGCGGKCGGGCGCKSSGGTKTKSSGCGCGGAAGTVATTSASRGASLMQCENTVVCESYAFRVYKAPRKTDKKAGAITEAFLACIAEFMAAMPPLVPPSTNAQDVHDWCVEVHDAFADWFMAHPTYDCDLARRIAAIACPNPNDQNFIAGIQDAQQQFLLGALEILLSCLCYVMMPPCPSAPADDCVPLAVITVDSTDGCRVQSICNWTTQRKYVTTFPSLQYWLSVLPFGRLLRESIENLCCHGFVRRGGDQVAAPPPDNAPVIEVAARRRGSRARATAGAPPNGASATDVSPSTYFRGSPQSMARSRDFMTLALRALASRDSSANAEKLVLGMLGDKDAQGNAPLSELESENLLQFLVLDQMVKPSLRNVAGGTDNGGNMLMRMVGAFLGGGDKSAAAPDVSSQVDDLRAAVERQQRQIDELMRRPAAGPNA